MDSSYLLLSVGPLEPEADSPSGSLNAASFSGETAINHARKENAFHLFSTKLINFKCQVISTSLS